MANRCTICKHSERLEIDRQIVKGIAHLRIAKKYELTPSSVGNHAREHLSRQLLTVHDIKERANAGMLLDEIDICLSKAKQILEKAEEDNKPTLQLAAIREIRQTIEFLSKLAISLAQLQQEKEVQNQPGQKTIIFLPKKEAIDSGMSAKDACRHYLNAIRIGKENPNAEIRYEDEQPEQKMKRTKPPISKSAERVKASAQDSPDEEFTDIMNWNPNIPPKPSTWAK